MNSSNTHLPEHTQEDSNKVAQVASVPSSQSAPLPTETTEVITSNYVPDSILVNEHGAMIADLLSKKHGDNLIFDADKKQWRAFCNGMWCGQSPASMASLLRFGYPADKIKWFRGGMQTWQILGLTTVN